MKLLHVHFTTRICIRFTGAEVGILQRCLKAKKRVPRCIDMDDLLLEMEGRIELKDPNKIHLSMSEARALYDLTCGAAGGVAFQIKCGKIRNTLVRAIDAINDHALPIKHVSNLPKLPVKRCQNPTAN